MLSPQKQAKISEMENRLNSLLRDSKGQEPKVSQEFQDLVDKYTYAFKEKLTKVNSKQSLQSDIYQRVTPSSFKRAQTPQSRTSTQILLTSRENIPNYTSTPLRRSFQKIPFYNVQQDSPFKQRMDQEFCPANTSRSVYQKTDYENKGFEFQNSKIEQNLPIKKLINLYSIVDNMDVHEFKSLPTL